MKAALVQRGEVWWAALPEPRRSEPGFTRPVVVIQSGPFNRSRLQTTIVAVMTSNLRLARSPGNVIIPATASGLPEDSVVNVSQIMSVDREFLVEHVGKLPPRYIASIDDGLRFILDL